LYVWVAQSLHKCSQTWLAAQKWSIVSERNLLIPNNGVWNRDFAKTVVPPV